MTVVLSITDDLCFCSPVCLCLAPRLCPSKAEAELGFAPNSVLSIESRAALGPGGGEVEEGSINIYQINN